MHCHCNKNTAALKSLAADAACRCESVPTWRQRVCAKTALPCPPVHASPCGSSSQCTRSLGPLFSTCSGLPKACLPAVGSACTRPCSMTITARVAACSSLGGPGSRCRPGAKRRLRPASRQPAPPLPAARHDRRGSCAAFQHAEVSTAVAAAAACRCRHKPSLPLTVLLPCRPLQPSQQLQHQRQSEAAALYPGPSSCESGAAAEEPAGGHLSLPPMAFALPAVAAAVASVPLLLPQAASASAPLLATLMPHSIAQHHLSDTMYWGCVGMGGEPRGCVPYAARWSCCAGACQRHSLA